MKFIAAILLLACCGCAAMRVNQPSYSSNRQTAIELKEYTESLGGGVVVGESYAGLCVLSDSSGHLEYSHCNIDFSGKGFFGDLTYDRSGTGLASLTLEGDRRYPALQIEEFNYGVH